MICLPLPKAPLINYNNNYMCLIITNPLPAPECIWCTAAMPQPCTLGCPKLFVSSCPSCSCTSRRWAWWPGWRCCGGVDGPWSCLCWRGGYLLPLLQFWLSSWFLTWSKMGAQIHPTACWIFSWQCRPSVQIGQRIHRLPLRSSRLRLQEITAFIQIYIDQFYFNPKITTPFFQS